MLYLDVFLNRLVVIVIGFQETFKALSDPVRREILTMLKNGRMSAGDIASKFDITNVLTTNIQHISSFETEFLINALRRK